MSTVYPPFPSELESDHHDIDLSNPTLEQNLAFDIDTFSTNTFQHESDYATYNFQFKAPNKVEQILPGNGNNYHEQNHYRNHTVEQKTPSQPQERNTDYNEIANNPPNVKSYVQEPSSQLFLDEHNITSENITWNCIEHKIEPEITTSFFNNREPNLSPRTNQVYQPSSRKDEIHLEPYSEIRSLHASGFPPFSNSLNDVSHMNSFETYRWEDSNSISFHPKTFNDHTFPKPDRSNLNNEAAKGSIDEDNTIESSGNISKTLKIQPNKSNMQQLPNYDSTASTATTTNTQPNNHHVQTHAMSYSKRLHDNKIQISNLDDDYDNKPTKSISKEREKCKPESIEMPFQRPMKRHKANIEMEEEVGLISQNQEGQPKNIAKDVIEDLDVRMEKYRLEFQINRYLQRRILDNVIQDNLVIHDPNTNHSPKKPNSIQTSVQQRRRRPRMMARLSTIETQQCPICLEQVNKKDSFRGSMTKSCQHRTCDKCAVRMLVIFAKDKKKFPIPCPQCSRPFNVKLCLKLLQKQIKKNSKPKKTKRSKDQYESEEEIYSLEETQQALEAIQFAYVKSTWIKNPVYCSNPKCNCPFDWDVSHSREGKECPDSDSPRITCPLCKTDTCASCKVPWHKSKSCVEFSKNIDMKDGFHSMIVERKWTPCPDCGYAVERTEGCNNMVCVCKCRFCYKCGKVRGKSHTKCVEWTKFVARTKQ